MGLVEEYEEIIAAENLRYIVLNLQTNYNLKKCLLGNLTKFLFRIAMKLEHFIFLY